MKELIEFNGSHYTILCEGCGTNCSVEKDERSRVTSELDALRAACARQNWMLTWRGLVCPDCVLALLQAERLVPFHTPDRRPTDPGGLPHIDQACATAWMPLSDLRQWMLDGQELDVSVACARIMARRGYWKPAAYINKSVDQSTPLYSLDDLGDALAAVDGK